MRRDSRAVLQNLSLELPAGSSLAVVGPSGSGKSTLLETLTGVLKPDSGEVIIEGFHVTAARQRELAAWRLAHVGIVFQFAELLPELTLQENVVLPLLLTRRQGAHARRAAMAWLERLGVAHLASRFPAEVSGGERQRAAVARALAGEPRLVVADEPTGSLDPANASLVARQLLSAAARVGATTVLVTHNHAIAASADRVVMLQAGRLVDFAPSAPISASG